jgi:multiple sugar transport system ATP-binding protein
VALGRAIVRDPKVFLFDEPLSNLDAKLRVQMRVELKKLHERLAVTSVYVTHDQVEAMTLGDRVVVMKDGWVQQVGEPLDLYNRPANRFVAGFIGSPAMNFAEVTLAEHGGKIVAEATGLKIALPEELAARARAKMNGAGTPATLGIRPEDVHVAGAADSSDHCFDANVEVVEQLGSEILLDSRVGSALVVASIDPAVRVRAHDKLRLALKPERLHLFDPQTEMAF